jgi:hydrogenase nickel incorporation protein HypA/HybF
MHELSVCQQMLLQVTRIASEHRAERVERIVIAAGPLCGVEPHLLKQAFSLARIGTVAAKATLVIEQNPVRIRCRDCLREHETPPNRLLCPECGTWQVDVTEGEHLLLKRVELADVPDKALNTQEPESEEQEHHV